MPEGDAADAALRQLPTMWPRWWRGTGLLLPLLLRREWHELMDEIAEQDYALVLLTCRLIPARFSPPALEHSATHAPAERNQRRFLGEC